MDVIHVEISIVLALILISAVAVIVRWIRLPYTIALVLLGLVLGQLNIFPAFHLTPSLLLNIFLPILLFEGAFHLQARELTQNMRKILYMAFAGVLTTLLIAGPLSVSLWSFVAVPIPLILGLFFASMVSATDPISVLAILKQLKAPKELTLILEGESLFNDGLAVVVFFLLMEIVVTGHSTSIFLISVEFIKVAVGGVLVGALFGLLFSQITSYIEDHLVEITLTTILAFSAFLAAEHLHVSGVLAVVVAGILMGNIGGVYGMSPVTQAAVGSFWEYAAFVVNSFVFLLTGMEIARIPLLTYLGSGALALFAVLLSRIVVVYIGGKLFKLPFSYQGMIFWGGIRGSLSLVMVLALPDTFPHRDFFLGTLFSLVLISLIVQGGLLKGVMKLLGLKKRAQRIRKLEKVQALLRADRDVLHELERLRREGVLDAHQYHQLRGEVEEETESLKRDLESIHRESGEALEEEMDRIKEHLQMVRTASLRRSFRLGLLSREILNEILTALKGGPVEE